MFINGHGDTIIIAMPCGQWCPKFWKNLKHEMFKLRMRKVKKKTPSSLQAPVPCLCNISMDVKICTLFFFRCSVDIDDFEFHDVYDNRVAQFNARGEDGQRALFTPKNGSKILLLQIADQCVASVMTTVQLRSRRLQRKVLCCPGHSTCLGWIKWGVADAEFLSLIFLLNTQKTAMSRFVLCVSLCSISLK